MSDPKPPADPRDSRMPFPGRDLDFEEQCKRELEADVDEDWLLSQLEGESEGNSGK